MQSQVRIGGKGTPRRKQIEEVNMFKEDGNVIHFTTPKVQASIHANTFAIYGQGEEKELTELVPDSQRVQSENPGDDDDIPELVENFEAASEQKKEDETPAAASASASGSGTGETADTTAAEKTEDKNVEEVD
ncbi:nascent polypeptide-associated complex subunit beta [Rhizophagus clarus]|uniref:Nascent polypeptide-associated complex subunit beta n=1 Tax=Rhizophagus clarus TaxID=94130 RepID=A0A8H3QQF9_9GLOM|nr:nascent polypeptide-associated complex subunit beta [Rhizophagus clarus]